MKATLEMINRMQADGVIGKFAIGGAVGATFYLEPSATIDVDVFVMLPTVAESPLLSLKPIYHYLTAHGCRVEGAHVVIADWPVQFLPAHGGLHEEALREAVRVDVDGVSTCVMTAEHLVAIALQTGRAKDHARILQFLDSGVLDRGKLNTTLMRHGLTDKWDRFASRFLEGQ